MGVLKLSVIEEREKAHKSKMKVVVKDGKEVKPVRISNCACPCECFIKEGEVRMDDIADGASWNID